MKDILVKFTAALLVLSLTGCAEMIGAGIGISESFKEIARQNIRYCGPDAEHNLNKDKESFWTRPITNPDFDKLCGKSNIEFLSESGKSFEPIKIEEFEIYKIVGHFEGKVSVKKDEIPSRPYVIVGTLKFPNRWYYDSTINAYMKEKMSEHGAHAIIEYNTYQESAMVIKSEVMGQMMDVYKMRMEAKLIRYTD